MLYTLFCKKQNYVKNKTTKKLHDALGDTEIKELFVISLCLFEFQNETQAGHLFIYIKPMQRKECAR